MLYFMSLLFVLLLGLRGFCTTMHILGDVFNNRISQNPGMELILSILL
jgi:hypothetical protein